MSAQDLELFRKFAAETLSRPYFAATYLTFNGTDGNWKFGKDKKICNEHRLAADVADAMPWRIVRALPFWDPETREMFVFTAEGSSGDAIANLTLAWADYKEAHPTEADYMAPLIELASRPPSEGEAYHVPIFNGIDWIERPAALRHLKPPAALSDEPKSTNDLGADMNDAIPF